MPAHVVGERAQEYVGADPLLRAVANGPNVEVGFKAPKDPLDVGEGLIGGDDLGRGERLVTNPQSTAMAD